MITRKGTHCVGVKYNESDEIVCEKCGCTELAFDAHLDYSTHHVTMYHCKACGNPVSVKQNRDRKSKMLWTGE